MPMTSRRASASRSAHPGSCQVRAVARLVRPHLGEEGYETENACFRDAGRTLAAARDAEVRYRTFEALLARYGEALDAVAMAAVEDRLATERGTAVPATDGAEA